MTTDTIVGILGRDELRLGLTLGAFAAVVVLLATWRRPRGDGAAPVPLAGPLFTAGGAATIAITSSLPLRLAAGLVLLAAAGQLAGGSASRAVLLALPGAGLVALAGPSEPAWVPVGVALAVVVGGTGAANLDRRYATLGVAPMLLGVSVLGVYVAVPETRAALALVGVAAALTLAAWPRARVRLGDAGAFASVGLMCWVVADGGITRSSAVIGGLACLGLLVVEPASRWVRAVGAADRVAWPSALVALHGVTVIIVARLASVSESPTGALAVTSITFAGALGVSVALAKGPSRSPG